MINSCIKVASSVVVFYCTLITCCCVVDTCSVDSCSVDTCSVDTCSVDGYSIVVVVFCELFPQVCYHERLRTVEDLAFIDVSLVYEDRPQIKAPWVYMYDKNNI